MKPPDGYPRTVLAAGFRGFHSGHDLAGDPSLRVELARAGLAEARTFHRARARDVAVFAAPAAAGATTREAAP